MFQRFHNLQNKPAAGGLKTSIQACGMGGNSTNSSHNENSLDTSSSLSLLMKGEGENIWVVCTWEMRNLGEWSSRVYPWSQCKFMVEPSWGHILRLGLGVICCFLEVFTDKTTHLTFEWANQLTIVVCQTPLKQHQDPEQDVTSKEIYSGF